MFFLVTRKMFFTKKRVQCTAPDFGESAREARSENRNGNTETDVTHIIAEPFFVVKERMVCIEIFPIAGFCDLSECNYFPLLQPHCFFSDDVSQMEEKRAAVDNLFDRFLFSGCCCRRERLSRRVEYRSRFSSEVSPLKVLIEVSDVSFMLCDNMLAWPRLSTISKKEREKKHGC